MSVEFTVGGHTYRAGKLDAKRQLHVTRRIGPLLVGVLDGLQDESLSSLRAKVSDVEPEKVLDVLGNQQVGTVLKPVLDGLATLPEADVDYVIDACLRVTERQQPGGGWARVMNGAQLQFEDLDMPAMLQMVWQVLQCSLAGFFAAAPSDSPRAGRM